MVQNILFLNHSHRRSSCSQQGRQLGFHCTRSSAIGAWNGSRQSKRFGQRQCYPPGINLGGESGIEVGKISCNLHCATTSLVDNYFTHRNNGNWNIQNRAMFWAQVDGLDNFGDSVLVFKSNIAIWYVYHVWVMFYISTTFHATHGFGKFLPL